jgi:hypothetical protein
MSQTLLLSNPLPPCSLSYLTTVWSLCSSCMSQLTTTDYHILRYDIYLWKNIEMHDEKERHVVCLHEAAINDITLTISTYVDDKSVILLNR